MEASVGGTSLSTFGLKLLKVEGDLDMPKFKQILENHEFTEDLLKLDEKTVRVRLFGKYASQQEIGLNVANFMNHVKSEVRHRWKFPTYSFDELCVVKDGISSTIHGRIAVELLFTLTVTAE